ncbi:hypothetical protein HQN87_26830 [Paenibacillus tritici]|uniref:DUF4359 domain-containing protein n=1 Tax=Paenibacillus tritici TaxID=1873425 RepID=A0ABX2DW38_9BACL|nr:hypothetical protein [Paenibacillus tritici]NQX48942.1 hypothetical protein [Paenibacillus tritici]QUL52464.1 hypothetical protein KDC22_18600 [Paenibacillus tritici]
MPQPERRVRKRTGWKWAIVLIVILVVMAVLNPGKEEFSEYAVKDLKETLGTELAGGITELVAQPLVESFTLRDNYILFSMFSIPDIQNGKSLIGDRSANRKYLGLFKIIFIKL